MSELRIDQARRSTQGQSSALLSVLFGRRAAGGGQGGSRVHMLLDAACDQRIYTRLMEFAGAVHVRSLYQGDLGESLAHVSPYLLAIREDQLESRWFAEAGFGRSWGLFVTAPIEFEELRRHLRKFNIVYRENGTPLVFRFYDPRVLRRFLPTCTPDELRRFFGPIESFLIETEEADALLRFTLRGDELIETRLAVRV